MEEGKEPSLGARLKHLVLGGKHDIHDTSIFHKLSLIAFFAWVGLGADGLSSSCYGPEEAFLALQGHTSLSIFVALMSGITVLIIAASYSQIIELFPTGGGGYLVASKLISPTVGMISGCALLIDYVLTIALSIASGADAIFSFLPPGLAPYKVNLAILGVVLLTLLNMRGVKESVLTLISEEFNWFLTVIFPHDQLQILAYNEVVKDLSGLTKEVYLNKIAQAFTVKKTGSKSPQALHQFCMYLDTEWYTLIPAFNIPDDPIESLDVQILQNILLDPVLGIKDPRTDKRIDFMGESEVRRSLSGSLLQERIRLHSPCTPPPSSSL